MFVLNPHPLYKLKHINMQKNKDFVSEIKQTGPLTDSFLYIVLQLIEITAVADDFIPSVFKTE